MANIAMAISVEKESSSILMVLASNKSGLTVKRSKMTDENTHYEVVYICND